MAKPAVDSELVRTLDYILNRCDSSSIEVITEAVVRRRRDLSLFNTLGNIPDPQRMAKEITERINAGIGSGIEGMKNSVREMIARILREHAPELADSQIEELTNAWLPSGAPSGAGGNNSKDKLPADVLLSMIEQFISFSNGEMNESTDKSLREEMRDWPARYWKAFSPAVRGFISDYLKDKISEREFKSKIALIVNSV